MRRSCLALLAACALAGCAALAPVEPLPATDDSTAAAAPPAVGVAITEPASPAPEPAPHWATRSHLWDTDDPARRDLWARIRAGLAIDDADDELVRRWERYYADRPAYVARMTERGGRYLFHIVEEVEARGLPMELALLPFIESAFDPEALSRVRAAGMWQFMPATGEDFDLTQNLFRDDRRDVLASTRAALDYLQSLHATFGDWHLALAAYNWGQGNVSRAIRRNTQQRRPADYASLRMPAETRNYVPKLQAIENIVARPEAFGLTLPPLQNHPYFLSVPIERDIDVAVAADLAGVSVERFRQFNPQHHKPVILAAGTPQVLLPYDAANAFARALQTYVGPMSSWTAWVAPRTVTAAEAAKLAGTTEAVLREANRIPPNMRVKAGSTLLVPRPPEALDDVDPLVANHARLQLAPDPNKLRRVVLRVGKQGDRVSLIARRYGLAAADVARWNQVGLNHVFKPGSRVVVMKPVKRSGSAVKRVSARPAESSGGSPSKQRVAE